MAEKHSGLRGWVYRRTPQVITALGYVLGISVLVAAASTVVIETTIMAGCTGTAEANVMWLSCDTPVIVLGLAAPPGSEVTAGSPIARIIDAPEQVKRAHYLQLLEEGLTAMADDGQAPPEGALDELKRSMSSLSAELKERTVNAPQDGWVVHSDQPEGDNSRTLLEAGQPFAGVANLDRVSFTLTVSDTRPPTVVPGEHVGLLLPEWSVAEVICRARELGVIAVVELPRTALNDAELSMIDSGTPISVRVRGVLCPVQSYNLSDSVTLRVSVERMPKNELGALRVGRNVSVALEHPDATSHSVRVNAIETNLLLDSTGDALPDAVRQALASRLKEGMRDQQITRAWVAIRRTTLFARLFGN